MINSHSDLKPYKSLLLARIQKKPEGVINDVLDDLQELLSLEDGDPRELVSRANEAVVGDLRMGYIHYVEELRAPWTVNAAVVDRVNELILVCSYDRHLAIYLSDTRWRSSIVKLFGDKKTEGLVTLRKIEPGLLNAAFVKGAARTLWLSGVHARTSIKADNKILSGISLQDALDPLGDQTYYFTAARCASGFDPKILAVGTSPRGSRVWVGSSRDWSEFQQPVTALLKYLKGINDPNPAPLPFVAVSALDSKNVKGAFDLAVVPPELLSDDPNVSEDTREEIETWSYYTNFNIFKETKKGFTAEVTSKGIPLGNIKFKMKFTNPNEVSWDLDYTAASDETEEELKRLVAACNRQSWVKIWYESGHTISDGTVIEVRHRDIPFKDFIPVDFSKYAGKGNFKKYDIEKEKPDGEKLSFDTIGNEDSLFSWVHNCWPPPGHGSSSGGWLACDDGSGEIADFIHLDEGPPPKLTLIHVKAAASGKSSRGLAVAKYEVVTSQAIKNLRNLDRILLDEGMRKEVYNGVNKLVWHNRKRSSRPKLLAVLEKIGSSFDREVIILQPHLIKATVDSAREKPKSGDAAKLRQLDTLLLGPANICHGLQARLWVVCADEEIRRRASKRHRLPR